MHWARHVLATCGAVIFYLGTVSGCADSKVVTAHQQPPSAGSTPASSDKSGSASSTRQVSNISDKEGSQQEGSQQEGSQQEGSKETEAKQPTETATETSQAATEQSEQKAAATDKATNKADDERTAKTAKTPQGSVHPFPQRVPNIPDFPKDMEWLNVSGPLRKQDVKGKFVLLDFWTYCCINCMHILPELKKLEQQYPNQLVVIGVHSAKFETEKGTKNIEEAILRYEIEHPVVNDADHKIWDIYGVRSWPTAILIDPEGSAVWGRSGEFQFEEVDGILKMALPYYREQKTLDETPLRFELAAGRQKSTPLRFPGKILADEAGGRLFIADSNHNRIVVIGLDGKLIATIGSGAIGHANGDFGSATLHHPQGMALVKETLYVADTENHMLRKVDLAQKSVTTIAGTGEQGRGWPGQDKLTEADPIPPRWVGKPPVTALNSPWDLWIHNKDLYIAMAGPHQIWKMPLDESEIGPYAGNGREDIVDGPLLSRYPYEQGYSSFAQPSGLTSDGKFLYVADSEGSSIRAVPLDPTKEVQTVIGTADLPFNRLFHFGDTDGPRDQALLQHCLGVAFADGKIYVADTYNNKIKVVDPKSGATKTLAGTGKPGHDDAKGELDEPSGLAWAKGLLYVTDTNNHQIRTIDPGSGKVSTLKIDGLEPPKLQVAPRTPDFSRAPQVAIDAMKVSSQDGKVVLSVSLTLPTGWKINPIAPMRYWVEADGTAGAITRSALGEKKVDPPAAEFSVSLPAEKTGKDSLKLSLVYYYCQEGGEGVCKVGNVVWNVPIEVEPTATSAKIPVKFQVKE